MHPRKNKTATKAKRTSSFFYSNSLSSSPGVSLLFALLLASYPQTAGAAPGKTSRAEDLRLSKKSLSNRKSQSDSNLPIIQRNVVKRDVVGALGRRVSPGDWFSILESFGSDNFGGFGNSGNPNNGGFGMNGNGGGNPNNGNGGGNSGHTTTPHDNNPFPEPTSTKKTSTTAHAQTTPAQQAPSSTPHTSTSPLPAAMVSSGTNNEQTSDTSDFASETHSDSNGTGTGTAQQQSHTSLTTGQTPPSSPNNSPYNPGDNPPMSLGSGSNPPPSSQSGSTRGLVIGLVVSLVLLLIICALAAFLFFRRLRKKRQERAASPYNDTAPWLVAAKTEPSDEGYISEKTETREGSVVSHAPSIASEPRMRARTPGGSSAIPVPYDPSEISDDVSAHFTFFPRDDSIGVPVPYPLALHIPARVAKAMAERDTRWQQYDNLERQPHMHGQSPSIVSDDLMTIPDRGSRRSTRRSMTDSMLSSGDGYYAQSHRLSSVQYSNRHPDSQSELTRSDVGGHGDNPSILGSENGDPLTSPISVADFPIPPPPAMARIHTSQSSSSRRLRRTSAAASGGTSYSPRLLSVSENPFATNPDIDPSIDSDRSSDDDGSRTPLGDENRRFSGLSAVGGGGAERVTMRASPARTTVLRHSDLTTNPFDDASMVGGDDRRVSSATAITEPGSIRDSEVYAGVIETVYAFPAPPDPTRRPSVS